MSRISQEEAGGMNVLAFLDMISYSEGTAGKGDDGYDIIIGYSVMDEGYADHPRKLVCLPRLKIKSTAAGRYQILARYWDAYRELLGLKDFSPINQDRVAIQQLKETRAYPLVVAGNFAGAINRCKKIWASLPGAGYGQYEQNLATLEEVYLKAGGLMA